MAATLAEPKSSRLDLRMTDSEKRQIEAAARINGTSVSQWSLNRLMESARREIAEQGLMRLSAESFDEFARLLDEASEPRFEAFKSGGTRWDR